MPWVQLHFQREEVSHPSHTHHCLLFVLPVKSDKKYCRHLKNYLVLTIVAVFAACQQTGFSDMLVRKLFHLLSAPSEQPGLSCIVCSQVAKMQLLCNPTISCLHCAVIPYLVTVQILWSVNRQGIFLLFDLPPG